MRNILIRADARAERGSGHVMRCLALGQAGIRHGLRPCFLLPPARGRLEKKLLRNGMTLVHRSFRPGDASDVRATLRLAEQKKASWVVVDGYDFGVAYVDGLRAGGLRVLFLDDTMSLRRYSADLILNQNPHARETLYRRRGARGRLLLGPRYALLRREFTRRAGAPGNRGNRRFFSRDSARWLVTMGGSDPKNATLAVLKVLRTMPNPPAQVTVAVGAENRHHGQLMKWIRGQNGWPCRIVRDADDMGALMGESDVAVSASGSTVWELSFMGVPSALLVLADNQEPLARALDRAGSALRTSWKPGLPLEILRRAVLRLAEADWGRMSKIGMRCVDGRGAERVINAMGVRK